MYCYTTKTGDAVNVVCLMSALVFVGTFLTSNDKESDFAQDGFCLLKHPFWLHSHLLCFACDLVGGWMLTNMSGKIASLHAPGIISHGIAHLALWAGWIGAERARVRAHANVQ